MKVLVITTVRFRQNGITSVIMNYYRNINKKCVSMDFVGPNDIDLDYQSEFNAHHSKYFKLSSRKKNVIKYCTNLYKIMKFGKYDVVHVHGSSHLIALELFVAKLANIKVRIAHSHNTKCDHTLIHNLITPIFNYSYTCALACSEDAGRWLFGNKNFSIINNGIDCDKYKFDNDKRLKLLEELSLSSNQYIIGNIAGFLPTKNHEFIISVAEQLIKEDDKFCFLLIGDGELFDNIKCKIYEKNLNKYFKLLGNVANAYEYYNVMDLFILPSKYEGFPMVLVEAQANGLNCIVSDKITKKTNITNLVKYCSIDENKKWIALIKQLSVSKVNRITQSNTSQIILNEKDYNVQKNTEMLYKIYKSLVEK
ncbi:glycosyltransferase [Massilimicrobiota sp. SW1139]|uniref:glycosyltransferase n=1 Tax=Massilimicrobiota sp. SW1139 TaxID=2530043 RepID=UPI001439C6A5|nr:glycosyltransferase [Massilimicrobiota sp. SW1139]NJE45756.1 glycosyltransferase family 1 protein [Massilimicrobiota sp. SW1139]